jgi:integrase
MRWSDIDSITHWWTIPPQYSKNGQSHRVPLSALAVEILENLHRWQHERLERINKNRALQGKSPKMLSPFAFPARRGLDGPMRWLAKATDRVRVLAEVDFRPHDLRRTAATILGSNGIDRTAIAKLLNHAEPMNAVTHIYDRHTYDPEKKHAVLVLDSWLRQHVVADEPDAQGRLLSFAPR